MTKHREKFPRHILEELQQKFILLFDRGYEIEKTYYHSDYYDGYWEVLLRSSKCFLKITHDQNEIMLAFRSLSHKSTIDIKRLIYFLSEENEIVDDFTGLNKYEKAAMVLEQYFDKIEPNFGKEFAKFEKALRSSQSEYEDAVEQKANQGFVAKISNKILKLLGDDD